MKIPANMRPNLLAKRAHLQVAGLSVSIRPLHYWPEGPYRKGTDGVWVLGAVMDRPKAGPSRSPQNLRASGKRVARG